MRSKTRFMLMTLLLAAVVSVVSAAPAAFNLLTPTDGTTYTSTPATLDITWEEAVGATAYTFDLDRPVNVNVTLSNLTPEADPDALTCAGGTCTLSLTDLSGILTENGTYSWTVTATDGVETTAATNNPFTFMVDVAATTPGAFELVSPADASVLTEYPAPLVITWTESTGATGYTFDLDRPVAENVTLSGLTPASDLDELTCDAGTCTLTVTDVSGTLSDNGLYSWTVVASNNSGDTPATNNPFTFTVDIHAAPSDFNLIDPENNAVVRIQSGVTAFTWQLAIEASSYTVTVLKLSDNTRLGVVFNQDVPAESCGAETGICTFVVTPEMQTALTDGQYAWTVVAHSANVTIEIDDSTVEASNAPFFFSVNTGIISLVENGGFEAKDNNGKPALFPWIGTNLTGDKVKCNNELKTFSHSGECAFRFKGSSGESSKLQQNLDASHIYQGDTLMVSLFANTNISAAGTIAVVKIKYNEPDAGASNNGKDKFTIDLNAPTAGGTYEQFSGQVQIDGTPKKVKLQLVNHSTAGKLYIDDVEAQTAPGTGATETPTVEATATGVDMTTTPGATETATDIGPTTTATEVGTTTETATLEATSTATSLPVDVIPLP